MAVKQYAVYAYILITHILRDRSEFIEGMFVTCKVYCIQVD